MISPFAQVYADNPEVRDDFVRVIMEQFVRAGGTVSLSQWAAMTNQERLAMAEAQDKMFEERAEYLAQCISEGPKLTDEQVLAAANAAAGAVAAEVTG